MFGSTGGFGQSSSSPFGSPSGFGQTSNNPFAPKPFGTTNPFGFGSTSTGVFGAPQSSGSTSVFGASSSPAFGASTSTPAFATSSAFGSSSVFGQKPAFGAFGSSSAQTSPFGSSFQQSQPAFGSGLFGSSAPFGVTSQPAFGTPTTQNFGSASTPAFGTTTSPAFGTSNTPAFGSTPNPTFGSTGSPFGVSSSPVFGSTSAFGASSSPAFGVPSSPAYGTTSTPAFGNSATSAFGAPSAPSFSFGSSPAFGQSTSAFGSSPFGTATSTFGTQSSAFGAQTSAPAFGNPGFEQSVVGGQHGGTRVAAYQATSEADCGTQPAGILESILAMPNYKDKSHEELRWEDYQLGDKGGPAPAGQSVSGTKFGSSAFGSTSTSPFGQSSANLFTSTTSSNLFGPKQTFNASGFGTSTTPTFNSSPFASSNAFNLFGSTSSTTTSLFGLTPAFGPSTSSTPFESSSASGFGSSPSIFGSSPAQALTSAFGSSLSFNTQSSPLFHSTTPSFGQTNSAFGQTASSFGQSRPAFGQSNLFSTPSTGFGGNVFSSASLPNTSNTTGFGQTTVVDKPAPFRISSLRTSRHLSQRRVRLLARKYHPKAEGEKLEKEALDIGKLAMDSIGPRLVVQVDLKKKPWEQNPPLHNRWHPEIPPVAEVQVGEVFKVEMVDFSGGGITKQYTAEDIKHAHEDIKHADQSVVHYLSGPIRVVDTDGKPAEPGDLLAVEICNLGPLPGDEWGFTAIFDRENGGGFLTDHFPCATKAIWYFEGIYAYSPHIPGVRFPGLIHPGIIGTAPSKELLNIWNERERKLEEDGPHSLKLFEVLHSRPLANLPSTKGCILGKIPDGTPEWYRIADEAARTIPGRENGGNCDIKNLSRGSKIYLPVFVEGANLSTGDMHFSQGDGEVAFCGAIEMSGFLELKCEIIRNGMKEYLTPMGPTPLHVNPIFEIGPMEPRFSEWLVFEGISVDESGRQHYLDASVAYKRAVLNAIDYLSKFGYTKEQVYLLLSCCPCEGRISGIVDAPNAVATLAIPTAIFDQDIRPKVNKVPLGPRLLRNAGIPQCTYDGSLPITRNPLLQ